MEAPTNIDLQFLENTSVGEAVVGGKLDAALVYSNTASLVDSSNPDLTQNEKVRTLFPDPKKEAIRYYKKTGVVPINHMVVLRKEVVDAYPWAPTNIFKAFQDSKLRAYQMWQSLENWEKFPSAVFLAETLKEQLSIFGSDPFRYGLKNSRKTLETLARYMYEQGFVPEIPDVEKLFAESTRNL